MPDNAKKAILQRIQQALKHSVPVPFPAAADTAVPDLFQGQPEDLAILFAEQFTQLQGQFSWCESMAEVCQQLQLLAGKRGMQKWFCTDPSLRRALETAGWNLPWHNQLADCHASITAAECLVARTGTLVLSSTASGGRTPSVYAPVHICLATTRQLVYDISDALALLQQQYGAALPSQLSFASGPSRTADIEKTLVTGVHGPKEVFCFLIDQG
jgi:L-lactate dehydrogenase complex protein LldG